MAEEPKVTGLSPMTGPPGTKITIRGENLGQSNNDIIRLTINGADCLPYLEWRSSNKIIARCANIIGRGDIIITTQTGGQGTCDVQFDCHEQKIGVSDETAVWVEEDFKIADRETLTIPGAMVEYSVDFMSNRYNPRRYLMDKYSDSSFDQLEELRKSLRNKLSIRNSPEADESRSDRATLLKSNLPTIMECLQTLERLSKVVSSRDTSIDDIVGAIEASRSRVQKTFDPLLAQRDLVQDIENAMQQNASLFKLPSAIEESIQLRNYDSVVKDISSVLSRLETVNQEENLVAKIQQKVLAKVDELKGTIRTQLHHKCTTTDGERNIEEVKKLISNLHRLGDTFDIWDALNDMSRSLRNTMIEQETYFLKLSHEQAISPKHRINCIVGFVESAIKFFNGTFYDILNLGRSYFDPKDEFACKESDDIKNRRQNEFDEILVSKLIGNLTTLLRRALVPESQRLDGPTQWPTIDSHSYDKEILKKILQAVIECHAKLTTVNLPPIARTPVQDLKELLIELRIESMKRLFAHETRASKNLHIKEDWVIEVDDLDGGRTNLPYIFEGAVLDTLKFAKETVFKPSLPNEKSILKEVSVQAEMKGLAQSLINSFTECLDNALVSNLEHPAESTKGLLAARHSNRAPSKYMNRLLITMCNCQFTKDRLFPRLQEEFEKLENMKMDSMFNNCKKKYGDYISKIREKLLNEVRCRIVTQKFKEQLKTSEANNDNIRRDLQINLMIVNSEIFLIAPQLVDDLMTRIVNTIQKELNIGPGKL